MRILLLSVALFAVAGCVPPDQGAGVPPPPMAALPTAPPVALVPSPPPPPPIAAPAPPPVAMAPAAPPPPTQVAAMPPLLGPWTPEPSLGRLTLNNFSFDRSQIIAVVTNGADCNVPAPGDVQSEFQIPLNGTRIVMARPGADVCWKRKLDPDELPNGEGFTGWNRAYLSTAITVTSRL